MGHDAALAVSIFALVVVVTAGIVLTVGLWARRKVFAGPARDAWELTRHDLTTGDMLRVRRATMRHRPVGRPSLAGAQLVYTRYAQYVAEHSPLRRRSLLVAMCVLYGALGVQRLASGLAEGQGRVFNVAFGALFTAMAVAYGPLISRSMAREPLRMRQLRREVRQRYPDDWA